MKTIYKVWVLFLTIGMLSCSWAMNGGAAVKSLLLPGMGQMSGGGAHTYIGLGFLAVEVAAVHSVINTMSKASSYREETKEYFQQYNAINNYEDKVATRQKWIVAFNNASGARNEVFLWSAVAVGIWAINVVEAMIFTPIPTPEEIEDETEEEKETTSNLNRNWPQFTFMIAGNSVGFQAMKTF